LRSKPPAALISSTASEEPFFQLAPTVAPAPDSSMMLGILIVSCANAGAAQSRPRTAENPNDRAGFMEVLPNVAGRLLADAGVFRSDATTFFAGRQIYDSGAL
jgi:hypothetical protein